MFKCVKCSPNPHTPSRVLDNPIIITISLTYPERVSSHPPVLTVSGGPTDCWHPPVHIILPQVWLAPKTTRRTVLTGPTFPIFPSKPIPIVYNPLPVGAGVSDKSAGGNHWVGQPQPRGKQRITTYGLPTVSHINSRHIWPPYCEATYRRTTNQINNLVHQKLTLRGNKRNM